MFNVKFKKLSETAKIPTFAYESDAGFDLYADKEVILHKGQNIITTGIAWEFDWRYFDAIFSNDIGFRWGDYFKVFLKIEGKSGLAVKKGYDVLGGIVDSSYRGEIKVIIQQIELSSVIKEGQKIAQGIVHFIPKINIVEVDNIENTERGSNGFGSTGN